MSAFPLTRRAALAALGAVRSSGRWPKCGARWPSPASASAPSRSTFRRFAPAWEIRPRHGCRRRFPERSLRRSRPTWRRATATARLWWRGSTISISDQAAADPDFFQANAGHHQRNAPGQRAARRRTRERAPEGDLVLFPDGGRSGAGRAGLARPRGRPCAGVRRLDAEGAGSLNISRAILRSEAVVSSQVFARCFDPARRVGGGKDKMVASAMTRRAALAALGALAISLTFARA